MDKISLKQGHPSLLGGFQSLFSDQTFMPLSGTTKDENMS
jgi:hypothetical protein